MKKVKLQMLGLSVNDLLSREQMKKVMGGSGAGGSGSVVCGYQAYVTYSMPGGTTFVDLQWFQASADSNGNTIGDAKAQAAANGTHYCCDSCSWNQPNYA